MPENANTSRTWATFRVWGRTLNPNDISRRLELVPSEAFKAGDPRGSSGNNGAWRHGYWSLSSRDQLSSSDLQLHIEWLLDQLEPAREEIKTLILSSELQADIFCFWESATGHGGPVFSPAFLRYFASFELALGIDVYFAGEPPLEPPSGEL
jgi:hypothetical protein